MSTKEPEPEPEEWHLHSAAEHEVAELAHHPRQEAHRLREEAERGETGLTLAVILTIVATGATLAAGIILLIVWLAAGGL
jgi:hypothetical protein